MKITKPISIKFYISSSIILFLILLVGCQTKEKSNDIGNQETFSLEEAKKGMQQSVDGFCDAIARGDAHAASNFYTHDAIYMSDDAPKVVGRKNIEAAIKNYIDAGYTQLSVVSTWVMATEDYVVDTEEWTLSNGIVKHIGKSLVVWKMEDGIWKQYKDMVNTDSAEPIPVIKE